MKLEVHTLPVRPSPALPQVMMFVTQTEEQADADQREIADALGSPPPSAGAGGGAAT